MHLNHDISQTNGHRKTTWTCTQHSQPLERKCDLFFKVKDQHDSANVIKSCKQLFLDCTYLINHGDRNVTLVFKVKGQYHNAK